MLTSILKEAEIENLRIHDLRRTLGSYQAATGANDYIIGKSLGHKSQQPAATTKQRREHRMAANIATHIRVAVRKGKRLVENLRLFIHQFAHTRTWDFIDQQQEYYDIKLAAELKRLIDFVIED